MLVEIDRVANVCREKTAVFFSRPSRFPVLFVENYFLAIPGFEQA